MNQWPVSVESVVDSGARRPDGKARRPRIPGVFEGGATPPARGPRRAFCARWGGGGMPRPEGTTESAETGHETSHQAPDVRHGPAACSTWPPGIPRRSMASRTGRPRSTVTRTATGGRKRRTIKYSRFAIRPSTLLGTTLSLSKGCGSRESGEKRLISKPSGRQVSRSAGDPQRASPTSAPRRAVSVASVSGDGIARSRSEY